MTPEPENLRHEFSIFWVMEIRSGRANKQHKNKQFNFSFKERESSLARWRIYITWVKFHL